MADRVIGTLRANRPERKWIEIRAVDFQSESQVDQLLQALRGNEYATAFTINQSYSGRRRDPGINDSLNWGPLFRELAARQNLEGIEFDATPEGRLVSLLCDEFFLSPQNTTTGSLRSLSFKLFIFSLQFVEAFVSFLDARAASLIDLKFTTCHVCSRTAINSLVAALQRNSRLQALTFVRCEPTMVCSILHALAAFDGAALGLTKLIVRGRDDAVWAEWEHSA